MSFHPIRVILKSIENKLRDLRFKLGSAKYVRRLHEGLGSLQKDRQQLWLEVEELQEEKQQLETVVNVLEEENKYWTSMDLWLTESRIESKRGLTDNITLRGGALNLVNGPTRGVYEQNAYVTPFTLDRKNNNSHGYVYDNKGRCINDSVRRQPDGARVRNLHLPRLGDPDESFEHLPGRTLYLGHLMGQYGHFITETLSTFWALEEEQASNILFHSFVFGPEIKGYMKPFFEAFRVDTECVRIADKALKLESVFIPERTFHATSQVHERYISIVDRVARHFHPTKSDRTQHIFLSRSQLENGKRDIANAEELDTVMQNLGFRVVHPQQMSIQEQVTLYTNTKVMAGISGSALHNSIFLNNEATVIEIGDHRTRDEPLKNQVLCNLVSGCDSHYIPFRGDTRTSEKKGSASIDCNHVTSNLYNILSQI